MMSSERLDQRLPELLDELSTPRTPDWFDDFVGLTARTPQRPAWTLPERWLPMSEIARQPVLAPRLPLRSIAVGLLVIALVAVVMAFVSGQRHTPPPPFGLARTGLVAFDRDGDIYVADPRTGDERLIVAGPEIDHTPVWSLDGTRLAFQRGPTGLASPGRLYIANADGGHVTQVTPEALYGIRSYAFSPDGRHILISARPDGPVGDPSILLAAADGTSIRALDVGRRAANPSWRPPDGAEILFTDDGDDSDGYGGLYAVSPTGGPVRTILEPSLGALRGRPVVSPDGSRIAVNVWRSAPTLTVRTHIVAADGSGDRMLPMPIGSVWEAAVAWSNDGTRLLAIRGYSGDFETSRAVAQPVDGSSTGLEIDYPTPINLQCCSSWAWAPDDATILGTPTDATGAALQQVLLDPVRGTSRPVPWTTTSRPALQRLAP